MTWTPLQVKFYQDMFPAGWSAAVDEEGTLVIQAPDGLEVDEVAIAEHIILNIEKPIKGNYRLTIGNPRLLAACEEAADRNGLFLIWLGGHYYVLAEPGILTSDAGDLGNSSTEQLLMQAAETHKRLRAAMRADRKHQTSLSRHKYQASLLAHQNLAMKIVNHLQALWVDGYRLRKDDD